MSKLFSSFPGSLFCHGNALRDSFGGMNEGMRVYKTEGLDSGKGALKEPSLVSGWRERMGGLFEGGGKLALGAALALGLVSTVACNGSSEGDPVVDGDLGDETTDTTGETGGETGTGETGSDGTSTNTSGDTTDSSSTDSGTDTSGDTTDSGTNTGMEMLDAVIATESLDLDPCELFEGSWFCKKTEQEIKISFEANNALECHIEIDHGSMSPCVFNDLNGMWEAKFNPNNFEGWVKFDTYVKSQSDGQELDYKNWVAEKLSFSINSY